MGATKRRRGARVVTSALALAIVAAAASPAWAAEPAEQAAIGFSNLVARLDNVDEIGIVNAEYRVHILEAMREAGLNAVGAESLVFSRDESDKADFLLGGTVKELECRYDYYTGRVCRIGILWEVLNRRSDEVVYAVLTRRIEWGLPINNEAAGPSAGKRLVLSALRSLLARPRFRSLLASKDAAKPKQEAFRQAQFRACEAPDRALPAAFDAVADATVVLKNGEDFGSGFFLGRDGLILTAAHVVEDGEVDAHERGGKITHARTVRVSRSHDVALLTIAGEGRTSFPCLEVDTSPKKPGSDVYAIGAPARTELAFSLTRGIVSGVRTKDGTQLVQTDASISPGNSGGPLLDKNGRVVGVVSRKLAGGAVEGIAFGVTIEDGLRALGLEPGAATTATLLSAGTGAAAPKKRAPTFVDTEDAPVSLYYQQQRQAGWPALRSLTPHRSTNWVRVGGIVAGGVGAAIAALSWAQYQSAGPVSRADYDSYRTTNDVGWVVLGVGLVAFVTSFWLDGAGSSSKKKEPRP
jgi:S1-C subfamily serine protease